MISGYPSVSGEALKDNENHIILDFGNLVIMFVTSIRPVICLAELRCSSHRFKKDILFCGFFGEVEFWKKHESDNM